VSRVDLPHVVVGNDFVTVRRRPKPPMPIVSAAGPVQLPIVPVLEDTAYSFEPAIKRGSLKKYLNSWHDHSLIAFSLLFLIVAASAIQVGAMYWSGHITLLANTKTSTIRLPAQPAHGPNTAVLNSQADSTVSHITAQPINLSIAGKTLPVSTSSIRSWLQVVPDKSKGVTYIHVNQTAINKTLSEAASPYTRAAVNQVSVTHPDGSSMVIAAGRNGLKVGDTSAIAKQIGQSLLGASGMNLTVPTETQPFASVTPTAFSKLIEVNVVTKQMYLYDNGNLTKTYPISAGAPVTPTPIGQFKIYQKLAVQDMKGFNADGTKYLQPHVHWINYFLPGGYAVHGNYWRPLSWFGAVNSSHGCVSLPDDQAKEVYDWAPLGTTVITHY
jgi:lipoprotein-anchoring transpeptidase ErfK/SrfK